jgi:hypothetical protein
MNRNLGDVPEAKELSSHIDEVHDAGLKLANNVRRELQLQRYE